MTRLAKGPEAVRALVACPFCKALRGEQCYGHETWRRRNNHRERTNAAISAALHTLDAALEGIPS